MRVLFLLQLIKNTQKQFLLAHSAGDDKNFLRSHSKYLRRVCGRTKRPASPNPDPTPSVTPTPGYGVGGSNPHTTLPREKGEYNTLFSKLSTWKQTSKKNMKKKLKSHRNMQDAQKWKIMTPSAGHRAKVVGRQGGGKLKPANQSAPTRADQPCLFRMMEWNDTKRQAKNNHTTKWPKMRY